MFLVDARTSYYKKKWSARLHCKLFDCEGSLMKGTHKIFQVVYVQNLDKFIKYINKLDSIT